MNEPEWRRAVINARYGRAPAYDWLCLVCLLANRNPVSVAQHVRPAVTVQGGQAVCVDHIVFPGGGLDE